MKIQLPVKKARIEMLPLIDIVFLLLVFFIYAMLSMAVHRGMPVDLPVSETVQVDKKLILSVTVNADEAIYVDKQRVDLDNLTAVLKARAGGSEQPGVLLFADRVLPYQKLFQVLDKIRLAGLTRISLQADQENPQ
ncbi:MAG: biopolymer transporter ExbD [Desulfobacteraceae bacterium 4572_123]|nr:MAG: biopolymer transporter ExbD [Desulfobacteraceae bacterium 4572_123]